MTPASTMPRLPVRWLIACFVVVLCAALHSSPASGAINPWDDSSIAARAGPLSSAYRYVGPGEASIIEKSGLVPNVTRLGQPKNVSMTPLEYRSASQAEHGLAIGRFDPRGPGITPTHGVEVDLRGVPLSYGGTGATGVGGIEVQTPAAVRALRILELEP